MEHISKEKFERIPDDEKSAEFIARPRVTFWGDAWRRFKKNKLAIISLVILILLMLLVILGPVISHSLYGYEINSQDYSAKNLGPNSQHWFGTDNLGRDLFLRVCLGGRVSITIGLVGALVSTIIGTIYGAISAYAGGRVDTVMMRIVEILASIPYLLIVILVSLYAGETNIKTLVIAMTITGWTGMARLVRGQLLSLKNQDFILAAETLGVSNKNIILKHLIPNTLNVILIAISFDVPGYIFGEAFLSFLGIGIQQPATSWGALASYAQTNFLFYPYQLFFPALMIALTMLVFTLIGDGLRDALDPKMRQ
ncbi:MAG: ABC transporter permease [Tissierellia bacterium]|nr:ABC transporter permease [Tissierellia bacterium]